MTNNYSSDIRNQAADFCSMTASWWTSPTADSDHRPSILDTSCDTVYFLARTMVTGICDWVDHAPYIYGDVDFNTRMAINWARAEAVLRAGPRRLLPTPQDVATYRDYAKLWA